MLEKTLKIWMLMIDYKKIHILKKIYLDKNKNDSFKSFF